MLPLVTKRDDASAEWHRLDGIATRNEPGMRSAVLRLLTTGNTDKVRGQLAIIIVDTCRRTADDHGLNFVPTSSVYLDLLDSLTNAVIDTVDVRGVREEVSRILPGNISASEREKRLRLAEGLDRRTAISLERKRQDGQEAPMERQGALLTRSNLIAVSEVNRAVNASLIALYGAQEGISKALPDDAVYERGLEPGNLSRRARKMILTRRDERVCNYCDPLDGITARLNEQFDTDYGWFDHPPFHPRCRCFVFVTVT